MKPIVKSTTVLVVRRDEQVVMAADGQVTMNEAVVKHSACKIRRLHANTVLAGFAGSTADAFTLFEKFEIKLKDFSGNVTRAAVELTKDWRTDRMLRRLEALLLVADKEKIFLLSGSGDVIEPDHNVLAIGSGGKFAYAAARALLDHTSLNAREIATAAMKIAFELCIYTNNQVTIEELGPK